MHGPRATPQGKGRADSTPPCDPAISPNARRYGRLLKRSVCARSQLLVLQRFVPSVRHGFLQAGDSCRNPLPALAAIVALPGAGCNWLHRRFGCRPEKAASPHREGGRTMRRPGKCVTACSHCGCRVWRHRAVRDGDGRVFCDPRCRGKQERDERKTARRIGRRGTVANV